MVLRKVLLVVKRLGPLAIASTTGGVASAAGAANLLPALGFGKAGVKADSVAAKVQSSVYGDTVPADSWFAKATRLGATGAFTGEVAGPVGAVVAGAVWYYVRR